MADFDWVGWWSRATDISGAGRDSCAGLRARREHRLRDLLAAAVRAPYHRARLGARAPQDWSLEELRVFRKRDPMAHFDDCVTEPGVHLPELQAFVADPRLIGTPYGGRYAVWHSSSSSGEPGLFVTDERALAVYDAIETLRRPSRRPLARALDPLLAGERIAFVGPVDGHFAAIASFQRLSGHVQARVEG